MKLSRFLLAMTLITALALTYVHQNIELVKMSYINRAKQRVLSQLLDQNKILTYNIIRLKSPGNLETHLLAKGVKFELPRPEEIVRVVGPKEQEQAKIEKPKNRFFSFFTLRTQAEAKTTDSTDVVVSEAK